MKFSCYKCQSCIQWSLTQRRNDRVRKVTACLRSVDPDCQFQSIMIWLLLLWEGNHLENMVVILKCCGVIYNDLQLINHRR